MAPEPFVCPHCRTWVEGEGRVIRCPSCGKRFRADEARLDRPRTPATFETLDYEVPERGGWDIAAPEEHPPNWEEPEVSTHRHTEPPDYETPVSEHEEATKGEWEPWHPEQPADEPAAAQQTSRSEERESPWGWIIGIAVLLLFFVGGRFLSGELFIFAFVALIAVQWLLGRNKGDS